MDITSDMRLGIGIEEDFSTAAVLVEKKGGQYSVHVILAPFDKKKDADNIAELMCSIIGVQNIIPPKEQLH